MKNDLPLTFFHTPNSRSFGVFALLKELGAPYELKVINMRAGGSREPAYLAINPMGKVPALLHGDALITEQVAIYIYLADLFPEARLAPPIGDPMRGPYLRWMAFYGASFEPAVIDRALKRDAAPSSMCPYGDYETMLTTLAAQLSKGPFILGDRFTSADVLWGTSLDWTTGFKLVPELPEMTAYIATVTERPAIAAAKAEDAALAAGLAQPTSK